MTPLGVLVAVTVPAPDAVPGDRVTTALPEASVSAEVTDKVPELLLMLKVTKVLAGNAAPAAFSNFAVTVKLPAAGIVLDGEPALVSVTTIDPTAVVVVVPVPVPVDVPPPILVPDPEPPIGVPAGPFPPPQAAKAKAISIDTSRVQLRAKNRDIKFSFIMLSNSVLSGIPGRGLTIVRPRGRQ